MPRKRNQLSVALLLFFSTGAAPLVAQPANSDPVLRISVNLVQVDAVVTDSKGHHVTDLTAGDFEILEDGRPKKITAFSYVRVAPPSPPAGPRPIKIVKGAVPPPSIPVHLNPRDVQRTLVLMVDDLGLSFESTVYVRQALTKFVDERMQPGDLVAIMRTRAGMGALQQFTSDKRLLHAAIDHVRWYPMSRGGISAFQPLGGDPEERAAARLGGRGRAAGLSAENSYGTFRDENFTLGTLGAVSFVVRALRDLPGRKAVVLFSDGVPIFLGGDQYAPTLDALHHLADLANRSAVLIYTIDARGLQVLGPGAADNPADATPGAIESALQVRRNQYFDSQQGMNLLAQETGGFLIHDSNDLAWGVDKILEDLSGYYLIGYKPDEESFKEKNGQPGFHRIRVRVKRKGLSVRSRSGFLGMSDEQSRPAPRSRVEQLRAALTSPFNSGGVRLRLTCLFSEVPKKGAVVRVLLHIDPHDVSYTDEAGDRHKSVLDIVAFAFDEQGAVMAASDRTYTSRLSAAEYRAVLRDGFLYWLDVSIPKPGAYQMRAAVRDSVSAKTGSASEFIEIPNLGRHRMELSGIVLNGESQQASGEGTPAVRVFRAGESIKYVYLIFNARMDGRTHRPDLGTQLVLYRGEERIYTGEVHPYESPAGADYSRLVASGKLQLGTNLQPGEYVLQAIVRDNLAKEKSQMAAQSVDFEVRE